MSEHQIVLFRAIDAPVSKKNLDYMRKQSSRAEITEWSFNNQYHWGDFRGNEIEMMRRGYDMHLHYANFGIRKLLIRFPTGFVFPQITRQYLKKDGLKIFPEKSEQGAILEVNPSYDAGFLDDPWDMPGFAGESDDEMLDSLLSLRAEMIEGDLRPWYLFHLAVSRDQDHDPDVAVEAPVPAGMSDLTAAQRALSLWYCLDESLIQAAAVVSPELRQQKNDIVERQAAWLKQQAPAEKEAWLLDVLGNSSAKVRATMLAKFQQSAAQSEWPVVERGLTMSELDKLAKECAAAAKVKADKKAAANREKFLVTLAADPKKYLQQTEKLIKERSTEAYSNIATMLADLRDALQDSGRGSIAITQAEKLKRENPTLKMLARALKEKGLLGK